MINQLPRMGIDVENTTYRPQKEGRIQNVSISPNITRVRVLHTFGFVKVKAKHPGVGCLCGDSPCYQQPRDRSPSLGSAATHASVKRAHFSSAAGKKMCGLESAYARSSAKRSQIKMLLWLIWSITAGLVSEAWSCHFGRECLEGAWNPLC